MGPRAGRRTAAITLILGILVVAAAGVALRDPIRETWHLRRFDRGTAGERKDAIERLRAIGGPRSAARLVEAAWKGEGDAEALVGALRAWARPIPPRAFEAPIGALASADPETWVRGRDFLASLGGVPGPALAAVLDDPPGSRREWRRRLLAVELLGSVEMPPSLVVPALAGALADPNLLVRVAAVRGLDRLGPTAAAAIPALEEVLRTESFDVRYRAWRALETIRGDRPATLGDLWRERRGPCRHPLPPPPSPATSEEADPALPAAELDRILAAMKGRGEEHLTGCLAEARDWTNPQLDRLFEGETLGRSLVPLDSEAPVRSWMALLEEAGCELDPARAREAEQAILAACRLRGLIGEGRLHPWKGYAGPLEEDDPSRPDLADPGPDPDGEAVLQAGIDAQTVFLFRELLGDLREALDPEDFGKLAALLRAVHVRVPRK